MSLSESDFSTVEELQKDILHKRLQSYLKRYFVKPLPLEHPILLEASNWLKLEASEKVGYYVPQSKVEKDFYPFLQSIILGHNRKILWDEISIPLLIERTFGDLPIESNATSEFRNHDLILLWDIPDAVPNIRKWEVVLQFWEIRALQGKKTLLLSTTPELDTTRIKLIHLSAFGIANDRRSEII